MVKGRLKIFDSDTKIVDALLASFPGIISPYEINNEPFVMEGF
jgi:NTE family protein